MNITCLGGGDLHWYDDIKTICVFGDSKQYGPPNYEKIIEILQ